MNRSAIDLKPSEASSICSSPRGRPSRPRNVGPIPTNIADVNSMLWIESAARARRSRARCRLVRSAAQAPRSPATSPTPKGRRLRGLRLARCTRALATPCRRAARRPEMHCCVHLYAASRAATMHAYGDDDHTVPGFDELVRLDCELVPSFDQRRPSTARRVPDRRRRTPGSSRNPSASTSLQRRRRARTPPSSRASAERLDTRAHDLHVLLRHRPRSIPQAQESA